MPAAEKPDLSLFVDILQTLNRIGAPYMLVGAFAATLYGLTRVTYDIDIVVDLSEAHLQALVEAYPLPRYYADPVMMRDSIQAGLMFNIIDTGRGEKADLVPLQPGNRAEFERRVEQTVEIPGAQPFVAWCARPEDVIAGKLAAWVEGRSRKHETDIFEMMVFHYLGSEAQPKIGLDEALVERQAERLGPEALQLWHTIRQAARQEAGRIKPFSPSGSESA